MILFVDDERKYIGSYILELEAEGYQVEFKRKVDEAFTFLNEHSDKIKLLILDVMMPPGEMFKASDQECGLKTGVHFYEKTREMLPDLKVMILTNAPGNGLAEKFTSERNCCFLRKPDYLPFELAEKVKSMLEM